jgi:hypothetical protein
MAVGLAHTDGQTPAVWLVVDRQDSLQLVEVVTRLAHAERHRLVCHPLPGGVADCWLAVDLLVALGKEVAGPHAQQVARSGWRLAEVWLRAEGIEHLFVLRAHELTDRALERLLELQRRCAFQLWLLGARPFAVPWAARPRRLDAAGFVRHWQREAAGAYARQPDDTPRLPLPTASFLTFRAACRRLLEPADFERIDRVFGGALEASLDWLQLHQATLTAVRRLELELFDQDAFVVNGRYRADREVRVRTTLEQHWLQFQAALGSRVQSLLGASSAAEQVVRLRAVQVACFRFGLLLEVPHRTSTGWPDLAGGAALDERCASRLRTLWMPRTATAVALALLTGDGAEQLAQLRLGQVMAGQLELERGPVTVPQHTWSLVQATLLERRMDGASDQAPLFVGPDGRPVSVRVLRQLVRAAAWHLGLNFLNMPGQGAREAAGRDWLQRTGARVVRLPSLSLAIAPPCRAV